MPLTLLILAAGMGSRYGGLKQIDPVGPAGETVLDYAVYDALRAGFKRVAFVIRRDFEERFRNQIGDRYAGRLQVDYVFQAIDDLPEGFACPPERKSPWGTGHAVWCARQAIHGPFAVINADDFYGADAFEHLAHFLQHPSPSGFDPMSGHPPPETMAARFAMVGYALANTLSEHGTVSRGLCEVDARHHLQSIVEQTSISAEEVGPGLAYAPDRTVSLNCWGLTPALFPAIDRQFRTFLTGRLREPKAEFYLPDVIAHMIETHQAIVEVLPTTSNWFGVTHRADKGKAGDAVAKLVQNGAYPSPLF